MSPRARHIVFAVIAWVVAFDIAFVVQKLGGAHESEFGGHPDEAAHYVTGLFVKDAIALLPKCLSEGSVEPLKRFTSRDDPDGFYAHYPKVGLGVWPPGFYVVQAAWSAVFGEGRVATMLLMAVFAATVSFLLYQALRDRLGEWLAGSTAAALLCLPLFTTSYLMVMAEPLVAVFVLGAVMSFGRFLDGGHARDALIFGVLSGLAILTKGTGMALALLPPVAIALTGKWQLARRPALWMGAAVCALLAGPWTWIFRNEGREQGGWAESSPSLNFTMQAAPYYLGKLGLALGVVLVVVFCIGLAARMSRREERTGFWASAAALAVGVLVFQFILPVGLEARHLVPVLPVAMAFVAAGLWSAAGRLPDGRKMAVSGMLLAAGVATAYFIDPPESKGWRGFGTLAERLIQTDTTGRAVVLVSSDARGEGQFISELAMREKRPGHTVVRGSKELAKSDWAGRGQKLRFETEDDLAAWMVKSRIDYLIADASMLEDKRTQQHDQVLRACEFHKAKFWRIERVDVVRAGTAQPGGAALFRVMRQ